MTGGYISKIGKLKTVNIFVLYTYIYSSLSTISMMAFTVPVTVPRMPSMKMIPF